MKMIINISEEQYELVRHGNKSYTTESELMNAVAEGTPLPEGHGNLIDYDDLIAKLDRYGRKNVKYQLPYSPTIIFADKDRK